MGNDTTLAINREARELIKHMVITVKVEIADNTNGDVLKGICKTLRRRLEEPVFVMGAEARVEKIEEKASGHKCEVGASEENTV